MEQFSLEKWLENPSRKITTRYGDREVRIICTDRKDKRPIVALMVDMDDGSEYITSHSINGWIDDEEKYPDKRDLFFADEEGLSEFEKEIKKIMDYWCNEVEEAIITNAGIKEISSHLLDLARKELRKEQQEKLGTLEMPIDVTEPYYIKGKEDALKSLPKWKDVSEKNGAGTKDYKIVGYYLVKGNYAIYLEDLEKLPKEE